MCYTYSSKCTLYGCKHKMAAMPLLSLCQRVEKLQAKCCGPKRPIKWKYYDMMSFINDLESSARPASAPTSALGPDVAVLKYEAEFFDVPSIKNETMHSSDDPMSSNSLTGNYDQENCNDGPEFITFGNNDNGEVNHHRNQMPATAELDASYLLRGEKQIKHTGSPQKKIIQIEATDPTELHFLRLARQIKHAGLAKEGILHIEAKVSAYVFEQIQEWLKNKAENK